MISELVKYYKFALSYIHFTIIWVAIFKGPTESPSAILSSISGNRPYFNGSNRLFVM